VASANLNLGDAPGDDEPGSRYTATCGRVFFTTAEGGLRSLEPDESTRDWLPAGSAVRWPDGAGNLLTFAYGSPPQVHVLDLESGAFVAVDPTDSPQLRPRVSGTSIIWEDERSGYAQVWRREQDGEAFAVDPSSADQRFAVISKGRVVWTDFRAEGDDGRWSGDGSPMGGDLAIGATGIQADLPMIGLNSLVYTSVEGGAGQPLTRTMHVVPLPSL
jgi:hypothetical protein